MRTAEPEPETAVIVLSGEYDLASRDQLRAAFGSIAQAPRAVLDFSNVTFIDSSVLIELVRFHNARAASGLQHATLVVQSANLLRLFDIVEFRAVLDIVETLDEAIRKNGDRVKIYYASSFDASTATDDNGSVTEGAT